MKKAFTFEGIIYGISTFAAAATLTTHVTQWPTSQGPRGAPVLGENQDLPERGIQAGVEVDRRVPRRPLRRQTCAAARRAAPTLRDAGPPRPIATPSPPATSRTARK
jgi:hypothetical protein